METSLKKTSHGLVPDDPNTGEWYEKLKIGENVHGPLRKHRLTWKHRKYFALLNVGFSNWAPGKIDSKYGVPEKNFDRFRKDTAILAGFYEVVIRLDGTTRIEAKSISFKAMDQEEFERLYERTIDVFLKHIYGEGMSKKEIDEIVEKYLEFA